MLRVLGQLTSLHTLWFIAVKKQIHSNSIQIMGRVNNESIFPLLWEDIFYEFRRKNQNIT